MKELVRTARAVPPITKLIGNQEATVGHNMRLRCIIYIARYVSSISLNIIL
jgi:hypothetical protein